VKDRPIDLFRPYLSPRATGAVADVLSYDAAGRAFIGQGPLVDRFEREFAALIGAPDPDAVVTTNSCTSALGIALKLAGVAHDMGHEVIAPPMTCTATSGAIVNAGARIVWADVDRLTGCIDPADVARKVTPNTRAIVAVDWVGRACDYWMMRDCGVVIIEDAAHALMATLHDEPIARSGGDYVCYSFGPIKHLTTGDGGAIVAHWGDAERARLLRWHGLSRRTGAKDFRCEQPIHEPGTKAHLTDLNAAIGLANLPDAAWVVGKHRQHAAYYDAALAGLPGVTLPPPDPGCAYWLYSLLVEHRDDFMSFMAGRGVETNRVHGRNDTHPAYRFPNGPLPGTGYYDAHHVAIPVGWWLDANDLARVVEAVKEWAEQKGAGAR
jgi:dTDP-4-amino-4,6-dideoxygalactose transaminase